jgi:hypothetical protein
MHSWLFPILTACLHSCHFSPVLISPVVVIEREDAPVLVDFDLPLRCEK